MPAEKRTYELGSFHLDPVERVLAVGGGVPALTPKAFNLLFVLVIIRGRGATLIVVHRESIGHYDTGSASNRK